MPQGAVLTRPSSSIANLANAIGTLPISSGGTGQTNVTNAINALLPSQEGITSGWILSTNGTNTSWVALPSGGVVSLTGTANQITASASTGAVTLSIATGYVGQTSITTLGTITTGTWNGTPINLATYSTGNLPLSSLASSAGISVSNLGAVPQWVHVGNSLSYSTFSTAGLTNSVTLFSLPGGGIIHGIKIKHSTAFSGGSISGYTISVGISGNTTKYAGAFNVFQAVATNVLQLSTDFGIEDNVNATNILATATSVGANLNAATAGVVDIWALLSISL